MNKALWTVVVIAVVAVGAYWLKEGTPDSVSQLIGTSTPAPSVSAAAKATPKTVKATTSPTPIPKTYTQLAAEYSGRSIQFNDKCEAMPKSFVLKNNASILLDNRSSQARTITLDGKSYSLGSYGYQVISVSSLSLPRTLGVISPS